MVLELVLKHFSPSMCFNNPSVPTGYMGTSKRWNAATVPYFAVAALAKLGTFFHINVNGFRTCNGAFHPLEVRQHPLGIEQVYGHFQKMKCCNWPLFNHCRICWTRHFFSYKCHWFWDLCWSISTPWGCFNNPLVPTGCMGTSKRWNVVGRPYSTIAAVAELGTVSHISVNGFGSCVGAFHLLVVPHPPLSTERVYGYLHEMKCYS